VQRAQNQAIPQVALQPEAHRSLAARLRGFGPVGILAILIILAGNFLSLPLSALLVLAWARLSDTPLRNIGLAHPTNWWKTALIGIAAGAVFKVLMKAVVMPLFGAPPQNTAYHFLVGNAAALPFMLYAVIIGAGFGEEVLYRGFFFERLRKLFGNGRYATLLIVLLTSAFFASVHYPEQGLAGAEQAFITGSVFAMLYVLTENLWLSMFTHAAFDVVAVAMIYWNVESWFAHLIFK
jgi:membrane protease YdiL (CAAX protease family)